MRYLIFTLLFAAKIFAQQIDTFKTYCPDPKWIDRDNVNPSFYKNNHIKCSKIISYEINEKGKYKKPSSAYNFVFYNKSGYITKCDYYENNFHGFLYYKYDSLNRIIEQKITDSLGNPYLNNFISLFSYDSTKSGYHKDYHYELYKNPKIDTLRNSLNQITEVKDHDYPKYGNRNLFFYNEEGKLSKKEYYYNYNSENIHRMNADGTEIKNNGELREIKTVEITYSYTNDLIIEMEIDYVEDPDIYPADINPWYHKRIYNKDYILLENIGIMGAPKGEKLEPWMSDKTFFEYFDK